jgi:hypothetical protein
MPQLEKNFQNELKKLQASPPPALRIFANALIEHHKGRLPRPSEFRAHDWLLGSYQLKTRKTNENTLGAAHDPAHFVHTSASSSLISTKWFIPPSGKMPLT